MNGEEIMFGYVVVNKQELKLRELDVYQSFYCGLCQTLRDKYGLKGQISLNFDMTFLGLLLSGLYEPQTQKEKSRCLIHPMKKHLKLTNECIDYAAKMTIVLTYFKCEDDWLDEKSLVKGSYRHILKKAFLQIKAEYPDKIEIIENNLKQIHEYEKNNHENIDDVSGCFGKALAAIWTYKDDIFFDDLYQMGFYLGKFIYIMDAYDDIEEDLKKKTYNPFSQKYQEDHFDEWCQDLLEMMISQATMAFEALPIIENVEIMRNILYSGVWSRYMLRKQKRMGDKK